ncbi:MAG: putative 4-hydroxybenzoate polyprenyltransferase [Desulfurococcales archaeon]|nr:putative 4-hydroxybenzoate polyprenyltransferase [Desulfurococcales archaeon]
MAAWDPGALKKRGKLHALARLVRIEHTLFSLPFAYAGAILTGYPITLEEALLIFTALLGLRTAAMAYNNIADLEIDRLNPRSSRRPLVTGEVSLREAYLLVVLGSIVYYISAALLNRYALLYSPLLWILALTYPYAKRIHSYPHYHLGLVLGFTVFGGAVAVAGRLPGATNRMVLESVPWLYLVAVTLWVAGFDIFYSVMDYEFDRKHGLGSVPARFGKRRGIIIGLLTHLCAALLLLLGPLLYSPPAGAATLAFTIAAVVLMLYGDFKSLRDESYIPRAFNQNLLVGVLISTGFIIDYLALAR